MSPHTHPTRDRSADARTFAPRIDWRSSKLGALCVALVLGLAGCGGGDDETVRDESLEVASSLATCQALVELLCHRTRSVGATEWTLLYERLDGLAYQWGRSYTLQVRITERRGSGAQDAPSIERHYQVLSTTSSATEPPEATFSLTVRSPGASLSLQPGGAWSLLGWPLACEAATCQALAAAHAGASTVVLRMDHRNTPAGPLYVVAVEPAAALR